MRKSIIGAIALIIMFAGTTWALDDTPENRVSQADRYLAAAPPRDMIKNAAEQLSLSFPMEQRQEFIDLMTKHLDIAALEASMKNAMLKHFSADELKALADFYGSSIGKSAMKKFGVYMADVMPVIQKELMKAQAKADFEINKPAKPKNP
jgi:hypothetical protein